MRAWLLNGISDLNITNKPLQQAEIPAPVPRSKEILIRVSCCGICHTELDEIEGRTAPPRYPVIPGHQIVGIIERCGTHAKRFKEADRVGVAWIFSACGTCEYCSAGMENLCEDFKATGRDNHGGYAEYITVSEKFAYLIPPNFTDIEAAPLLCAGAIGYRSLQLAHLSNSQTLGLTGFGSSGHLVLKMARYLFPDSKIFVFARKAEEQAFALQLGASWAGEIIQSPPEKVNAIIDTTPAWSPVISSLLHLKPGGRLIINAIRKESRDQQALLEIDYSNHLWMEKEIKSVANITRTDVQEFLTLASSIPIKPVVETYPFEDANKALLDLKHQHAKGSKVLSCVLANKE